MTVCSCSRKEKSVIEDNSHPVVNAQLKGVEFDDKIMMPTNLILLEDSMLVVYEPKIKDRIKNGEASSYVYVIDWEGNVLKKFSFDKSVSSFCVNDDTIPYVSAIGDDGELHVYECSIS